MEAVKPIPKAITNSVALATRVEAPMRHGAGYPGGPHGARTGESIEPMPTESNEITGFAAECARRVEGLAAAPGRPRIP